MSQPGQPTLLLYSHPVSSYSQKLQIALRHKTLKYTTLLPPDMSVPSQLTGPLHLANPRAEVPVLIHRDPENGDDVTLFESSVIMEYLEERFPEWPLLPDLRGGGTGDGGPPSGAAMRAKQRLIEEVCDTQYEAVNWGIAEIRWYGRASGTLAETLERNAAQHTRVLQTWLEEKLGDDEFFAGTQFGWADCSVAPIVNRSVTYGLGPEEGSKLRKWYERIKGRESVRKVFEEYDAAVEKMPAMAGVYRSGERKREYRDHRLEWMIKAGGIEVVREGMERGNVRFSWPDNE